MPHAERRAFKKYAAAAECRRGFLLKQLTSAQAALCFLRHIYNFFIPEIDAVCLFSPI